MLIRNDHLYTIVPRQDKIIVNHFFNLMRLCAITCSTCRFHCLATNLVWLWFVDSYRPSMLSLYLILFVLSN